jgi:hypothetical protein
MRKTLLEDAVLCSAVEETGLGLVDADLGGGVLKKRLALPGRGKRGGVRVLIATNRGERWFFMFGFEKNERDNITQGELEALKKLASDLLSLDSSAIHRLLATDALQEICHEH